MTMIPAAVICFLSGAGIVGGSYLAITATIPRHVRLDDALNWLATHNPPPKKTRHHHRPGLNDSPSPSTNDSGYP